MQNHRCHKCVAIAVFGDFPPHLRPAGFGSPSNQLGPQSFGNAAELGAGVPNLARAATAYGISCIRDNGPRYRDWPAMLHRGSQI
eukprot:1837920-Pyramimonas_sp.AAC.1